MKDVPWLNIRESNIVHFYSSVRRAYISRFQGQALAGHASEGTP